MHILFDGIFNMPSKRSPVQLIEVLLLFVAPPMQLVGGSGSHEGRVEILLHGEWGTVCDDDWDLNDANVVCKQLGYSMGASAARSSAYFREGSGIVWFDDVQCTGSEAHLYDCLNDGIGIHNCRHTEDAGVTCE